jgi:hypothetical protein
MRDCRANLSGSLSGESFSFTTRMNPGLSKVAELFERRHESSGIVECPGQYAYEVWITRTSHPRPTVRAEIPVNDLTGTADHIKRLQLTVQTHSRGGKAQPRGEWRTTGALAVTAVANVTTYWLAGNGIADLSTKAATGHCGHLLLPLAYSSQAAMDVSPSTRPRVTADLFQFVKWSYANRRRLSVPSA